MNDDRKGYLPLHTLLNEGQTKHFAIKSVAFVQFLFFQCDMKVSYLCQGMVSRECHTCVGCHTCVREWCQEGVIRV